MFSQITMGTGHKNKRGKNKGSRNKNKKIDDLKKNPEDQVYGKIKSAMGNRRFEVEVQKLELPTGPHRDMNCTLRGSLRQRVEAEMFVLVEPTDDEKGIVMEIYTKDEVSKLKNAGLWDFTNDDGDDDDDIFATTTIAIESTGDKAEGEEEDEDEEDFDIDGI